MSDFLTRLVQRQTGTLATIQPRTRSMFDPAVKQPDQPPPDLPVIDRVASSDEPRRAVEAPRHSIALMHPATTAFHAQRRSEAPVDGPSVALPETGARGTESSHEPPLVKATAVPRTAQGEGPTVSLHNQIAESDRYAARLFPSNHAMPQERLSGAPAGQERAVIPPPRLVEAQQATPMAARVTPPSLLFTGPQGQRGDAAGTTSPEPPVHVTIGRIEVTALPAPSPPGRKSAARPPSMSLADYLARRQGRGA